MRTSRLRDRSRRAAGVVAVGVVVVLTIAGSAGAATAPRRAREISTAQDPKLGTILVAGETVYTLKPSKTACSTACLKAWPPVLLPRGVKTASAGPGVDRSKLGTAAAHGARQVTYSGKRLYWYVKDTAPGQVRGNFTDKWGKWASVTIAAAASPSTEAPTTQAPATDAPATEAPATQAPETAPPATEAPATSPPQTAPPATSPPQTNPPATTSPGTGGIAF